MFIGFMAVTHAAIAAAATSLALGTADPMALGLAVLGSQLPDLDTTTSIIGKIFFPISNWIEDRFAHRTITHSFLATGLITAVALAIGHFFFEDIKAIIALPFGHFIACLSDMFTLAGVKLYYPHPFTAISVSNPHRRIRTGSTSEYWVLVGAVAVLALGIWLTNNGGATSKIGQGLGLRDSALEMYNSKASTHHVIADVDGVLALDSSEADGKYFIIAAEGEEFIVTNSKGIYKTGKELIANKLTASVGEEARTTIETLTFDDVEAIATLRQLQANHENAAIFLSGTLTVDFPEEIRIALDPTQYAVIERTDSNVKLTWCPVEKAIATLKDQFAVGTLSAKIISPSPDSPNR